MSSSQVTSTIQLSCISLSSLDCLAMVVFRLDILSSYVKIPFFNISVSAWSSLCSSSLPFLLLPFFFSSSLKFADRLCFTLRSTRTFISVAFCLVHLCGPLSLLLLPEGMVFFSQQVRMLLVLNQIGAISLRLVVGGGGGGRGGATSTQLAGWHTRSCHTP